MKRWPKKIKVWREDGFRFENRNWIPAWKGMLVAPDERVYVLETKPKKRKRWKVKP